MKAPHFSAYAKTPAQATAIARQLVRTATSDAQPAMCGRCGGPHCPPRHCATAHPCQTCSGTGRVREPWEPRMGRHTGLWLRCPACTTPTTNTI